MGADPSADAKPNDVSLLTARGDYITRVAVPAHVRSTVIVWCGRVFQCAAGGHYQEAEVFHTNEAPR